MIATYETPTCSWCGKPTLFILDKGAYDRWQQGTEAAVAFPEFTIEQLFTLIEGDHGTCSG